MDNQDLIYQSLLKAGITAQNTGGILGAQQSKHFITTTLKQSSFLQQLRIETGIKTTRDLDFVGVGSRLLHAPVEDVAPDDSKLKGINTGRRSLAPVEVMLPYNISLKYLEENIEGDNVEDTINTLFAKQFSNDILDLAFNGNTKVDPGNPDYNFLKITDSFISHLMSDPNHVFVEKGDSSDWKDQLFPQMYKKLPDKYKSNPGQLSFLVSFDDEDQYRSQLSDRSTNLGDVYLTENVRAMYKGIPVEPVPYINSGLAILTNKKNLALGFGRDITVYKMANPRARRIEYTITAKLDFNYVLTDLLVVCN
jgi:hypothetical protein